MKISTIIHKLVTRRYAALWILVMTCAAWSAAPADAVTVVEDGAPVADIYVNTTGAVGKNDQVLLDAGQWLAESLERACGLAPALVDTENTTPIIIIARADQYPQIAAEAGLDLDDTDAYCLVGESGRLYVLGASEFSARHGVADLLHEWGFRFYNPMPLWHHIPQLTEVTFDAKRAESPELRGRKIWYAYGVRTEDLKNNAKRWDVANRLVQAAPFRTGHSYGNIVGRNKEAFDQHPEYFALLEDGTRDTQRGINARKLCYSNPDLAELIVADRIKLLEEYRKVNPYEFMVSMDPSDGPGTCHCEPCAALGTATDRVIHLANEVAKGLREKHPDGWVGLYAYSSHRLPPTIAVEPNVYVQVAMGFNRTQYSLPQLVSLWAEKVSAIGLREYYGVEAWDWGLPGRARGTQVDYHRKWIPYYTQRNVNAINAESNANWGAQTLGQYVASQMMWDPTVDVDAIEDAYFINMYGEAAEPIRRMHKRFDSAPQLKPFALKPIFDDLQEAYELAQTEEVRRRITDMMSYLHYVRLFMDFQDAADRDRKHGDTYYDALGPLMTYAWRTRDRGMVHYYALARRLCNGIPLKDHRFEYWMFLSDTKTVPEKYLIESGVDPASIPDQPIWKKGEQLSDEEIQERFAADLAILTERAGVLHEFSDDLVPVDIGDAQDGASLIFLNEEPGLSRFRYSLRAKIVAAGPQSLALRIAPDSRKCEIKLTAPNGKVIYDDIFYSNTDDPNAGEAPFQDLPLDLPTEGDYELTIAGNCRLAVPPNAPMVFEASASMPAHSEYSGHHYFYVPQDTSKLRFDVDIRLSLLDPDGVRTDYSPKDRVPGKSYIEIDVPEEHRGRVWSTFPQTRGKFYFLNIPPYLSFYRSMMFTPREVAEADQLTQRNPQ